MGKGHPPALRSGAASRGSAAAAAAAGGGDPVACFSCGARAGLPLRLPAGGVVGREADARGTGVAAPSGGARAGGSTAQGGVGGRESAAESAGVWVSGRRSLFRVTSLHRAASSASFWQAARTPRGRGARMCVARAPCAALPTLVAPRAALWPLTCQGAREGARRVLIRGHAGAGWRARPAECACGLGRARRCSRSRCRIWVTAAIPGAEAIAGRWSCDSRASLRPHTTPMVLSFVHRALLWPFGPIYRPQPTSPRRNPKHSPSSPSRCLLPLLHTFNGLAQPKADLEWSWGRRGLAISPATGGARSVLLTARPLTNRLPVVVFTSPGLPGWAGLGWA